MVIVSNVAPVIASIIASKMQTGANHPEIDKPAQPGYLSLERERELPNRAGLILNQEQFLIFNSFVKQA